MNVRNGTEPCKIHECDGSGRAGGVLDDAHISGHREATS